VSSPTQQGGGIRLDRLALFLLVIFGIGYAVTDHRTDGQKAADAAEAAAPICKNDWHLCADNADMANYWKEWHHVRFECEWEGNKIAKYGDGPEWPSHSFGAFLTGDDYPKTGIVTVIENQAKFVNAFNAKVRTKVTCTYDLNARKVTNIVAVGH
jgi:hypothetical protein